MTRRFIYCNDILFQYIIWGKLFAKTVESFGHISEYTALAKGSPLKKLSRSCVELTKKRPRSIGTKMKLATLLFLNEEDDRKALLQRLSAYKRFVQSYSSGSILTQNTLSDISTS